MRGTQSIESQFTGTIVQKLQPALLALLEARRCADDTGSDLWEFAVAIGQLHKLGLDDTDLRWLVRKGLVRHARDITKLKDKRREFLPTENLSFCKKTCFAITPSGADAAESLVAAACDQCCDLSMETLRGGRPSAAHSRASLPHWDAVTRELRIGDTIVKRFKWQAVNQEIVLSAFEEDQWPPVIDDPLPPKPEQDTKRRLHDTIKALNRNQERDVIRFHGNGTGEGIRWELTLVPPRDRT